MLVDKADSLVPFLHRIAMTHLTQFLLAALGTFGMFVAFATVNNCRLPFLVALVGVSAVALVFGGWWPLAILGTLMLIAQRDEPTVVTSRGEPTLLA